MAHPRRGFLVYMSAPANREHKSQLHVSENGPTVVAAHLFGNFHEQPWNSA